MGFDLTTSSPSVPCSANCAKSLFGCGCESSRTLESHALLILEINKVQHVKWCMKQKKAHFRLSNRFLPSSVSRAWDWWSGGCEFKPHWGQILTKFILCCVTLDLSDNLTEMRQIDPTWKTQMHETPNPLYCLPRRSTLPIISSILSTVFCVSEQIQLSTN